MEHDPLAEVIAEINCLKANVEDLGFILSDLLDGLPAEKREGVIRYILLHKMKEADEALLELSAGEGRAPLSRQRLDRERLLKSRIHLFKHIIYNIDPKCLD